MVGGREAAFFTGGIGSNSVMIREKVLSEMSWIGIDLDRGSNRNGGTIISSKASRVLCLRINTDEERVIARHAFELTKQMCDV